MGSTVPAGMWGVLAAGRVAGMGILKPGPRLSGVGWGELGPLLHLQAPSSEGHPSAAGIGTALKAHFALRNLTHFMPNGREIPSLLDSHVEIHTFATAVIPNCG